MQTHIFAMPPRAEAQWSAFERRVQNEFTHFFDGEGPIVGARAPGRLDVLGGIADYSGSLVLEMPIGEAAFAAWQWRSDKEFHIWSVGVEREGLSPQVVIPLEDMVRSDGSVRSLPETRERLNANPQTRWASYIAGCFYVMLQAYSKVAQGKVDDRIGDRGANILLQSDVPLGAGVSSSAAIEVAAMHALSEAAGIHPSSLTLAAWCQRVENQIVGAPCGIMDQVTAALGVEDSLLALRCQPHELQGNLRIPKGWRFMGLDSRVKHSVGGTKYTKARVGAFMGLKIIQLESGGIPRDNYLCTLSPEEFAKYREFLPETLTGREYQELYGLLPDTVTRVDLNEIYHPRSCAEHPVLENSRAKHFLALMHIANMREEESGDPNYPPDLELLADAGERMYEAHASYSDRVDLGSPETDLLVSLIRDKGRECGLYGAKITGGGSGGTVAVLLQDNALAELALLDTCLEYKAQVGIAPRHILGSSPGAIAFGARYVERG